MNRVVNYHAQAEHKEHTDNDIFRMLLPSFLGIILCAACLVGLTFAWFSASVESAPQKLVASNWDADVQVVNIVNLDAGTSETFAQNDNVYTYHLASGRYRVTVTPYGTGSGYCKLNIDDRVYYTAQIRGDVFTFDLNLAAETDVSLTACWGLYSGQADVQNNGTLSIGTNAVEIPQTTVGGEQTPNTTEPEENGTDPAEGTASTPETVLPETYVVQEGDRLGAIAAQFGTTVSKLAAYNGISDLNMIKVGQVLWIPPADYEIPADTQPVETETAATPPETTGAGAEPDVTEPVKPEETAPSAPEETTPEETTEPVPETSETETAVTEPEETTTPEVTPDPETDPVEIGE